MPNDNLTQAQRDTLAMLRALLQSHVATGIVIENSVSWRDNGIVYYDAPMGRTGKITHELHISPSGMLHDDPQGIGYTIAEFASFLQECVFEGYFPTA